MYQTGWRNCAVWTNKVTSEICELAMQFTHCTNHYSISIAPAMMSNATLAKSAAGFLRLQETSKIHTSNNRPAALTWRNEDENLRDSSQDGLSLVGSSCPSTPRKPTREQIRLLHRNQ